MLNYWPKNAVIFKRGIRKYHSATERITFTDVITQKIFKKCF